MLVADMGAASTNLGFYDHTLKLSDSLDIGGKSLLNLLCQNMSIEEEKAKKLLQSVGLKDAKVRKSLEIPLEKLKDEMKKVIKYHDERFEKKTSKVILCGGVSNLIGLTEFLAEGLNTEVKVGNPWVNIDTYPLKPVPKNEAPAFANAIGLSLRGLEG